jgi:hypothetical protein
MTFLDTVDGKLARTTLTSSKWGDVFDHGIDLVHPPFWYVAWALGLAAAGHGLPTACSGRWSGVILVGYVLQRAVEGIAIKWLGLEIHIWRPIDTWFRQITARRNPNLALLTVGDAARPARPGADRGRGLDGGVLRSACDPAGASLCGKTAKWPAHLVDGAGGAQMTSGLIVNPHSRRRNAAAWRWRSGSRARPGSSRRHGAVQRSARHIARVCQARRRYTVHQSGDGTVHASRPSLPSARRLPGCRASACCRTAPPT